MPGPLEWSDHVIELLRELGVRYAVIGALAANVYRDRERLTTDADFLVDPLSPVLDALAAEGHEVRSLKDADDDEPYLALVRGENFRVDLQRPVVPYQHIVLDRAVGGVITVEDVIIFKLIAWRPRDQLDIRSILEAGRSVDPDYIERWVAEWEVSERWAEAVQWRPRGDRFG